MKYNHHSVITLLLIKNSTSIHLSEICAHLQRFVLKKFITTLFVIIQISQIKLMLIKAGMIKLMTEQPLYKKISDFNEGV